MDSILYFWTQMTANPLLFMAVTLTLGVILVNGWTDAPNAIATCVVTRCMPPKAAILMAAVFNFLGVFMMTMINATVAETMRKLTEESTDALVTLSWREIFDYLESCADACEHVSECVGSVIMKNT